MPAASPVSTEAPSRPDASARAGSARPSESGFSGQLAQALAAPAPDAPQPQAPGQQPAAEKGEATPTPGAAQAASPAPAASVPAPDPELIASQPIGEPDGLEAVAAARPDEAEPDEPARDPVQADALSSDPIVAPAPMPQPQLQPSTGRESAPVDATPEAPPDGERSDAVLTPAAPADAVFEAKAPESAAPESAVDEKAGGERDPSWPDAGTLIADPGQAASSHVTSNAIDAASLSAVQSRALTQAAKADAAPVEAAPTPPPPPAAQVAPAVAALVSTAPDGVQRIVVRLSPVELGQVEVRVERAEGGPAAIALTVERPETLLLLVRDQAGLHRALDQAGVPAEGRTVQFQLSQQDAGTPGQQPDLGAGGGWGGFGGQGARHGQGHANRGWHHPGDGEVQSARAWRNAGIDITA